MKTGISTICYAGLKETEDALGLIGETGAEVAEVYLRTFYEYRPEFAKKYANIAVDPKVCLIHANPLDFEPHLFSPSRRIRGDGFYWLDQVCRSAQLFGAEYFILHAPASSVFEGGYDELSGYINGAIGFCRDYGIKVALENVGFGIFDRPPVFSELKRRCGELYGVLDYSDSEYLKDMSGAIAAVYVTRACLNRIKELKKRGFDGAVILKENLSSEEEISEAYGKLKL